MSNSAGVSGKAEDAYPTGAPGPCYQSFVKYELLIYFCYFVGIILVTLCYLLWMSAYHVLSLSLDYSFLKTTLPIFTDFQQQQKYFKSILTFVTALNILISCPLGENMHNNWVWKTVRYIYFGLKKKRFSITIIISEAKTLIASIMNCSYFN